MRKLFTIIFLFACLAVYPQTNYFVKNGGNDGSAGTSDGAAWATITKVNTIDFVAGDSIFFNRGDTWANQPLVIDRSGDSGDHIYFGAYGSGAKPIIYGNRSIVDWDVEVTWTDTGGNIWTKTESVNTTRLWIDDVEVQKSQTSTVTSSFPWFWGSSTLYIYSATNPALAFSDMVRIYNSSCILNTVNSADYITLQYLDIRGGNYSISILGVVDWLIDSCLIGRDVGNSGVFSVGNTSTREASDSVTITNNVMDTYDRMVDAYSYNNTYEAISVYNGANNWDVHDNVITDWSHSGYTLLENVAGYPFTNNKFYDNTVTSPDIDYGRAFLITFRSNASYGNDIYNNYFYEMGVWSEYLGSETGDKLYNNVFDSVRATPYILGETSHLVILALFTSVDSLEIYNNIFRRANNHGIHFPFMGDTYTEQANLIINNIFDRNGGYGIRMDWSPGGLLNNTFSNNSFYNPSSSDVVLNNQLLSSPELTVAEFNALNGSTANMRAGVVADVIEDNIGGDPTLVDPPNDYHPDTGSPLIGAGLGVGINTDKDGDAVNEPPDIGPLAYNSSPPVTDPATVTTTAISIIKSINAVSGGNVTDIGGASVTGKGVCWSTSINPTLSDSFTTDGTGTGAYTSTMTGLLSNTTYHVRAWAENGVTSFGQDVEFTTTKFTEVGSGGVRVFHNGKLVIVKK